MTAADVDRVVAGRTPTGSSSTWPSTGTAARRPSRPRRRPRPAHHCLRGQQVSVPLDQPHLEPPAARRGIARRRSERDRPATSPWAQQQRTSVRSDGAGDRRALRAAQPLDAGSDQPDRHPLDRGRQLARAESVRDRPVDDGAPLPLERLLQRRDHGGAARRVQLHLPAAGPRRQVRQQRDEHLPRCTGHAAAVRRQRGEHHARPPDGQRPEAALRPSEQPGRGCRPLPGAGRAARALPALLHHPARPAHPRADRPGDAATAGLEGRFLPTGSPRMSRTVRCTS